MSDTCNAVVTMAVDTKKYGIRIHKALFRQLGEPRYIQLLVNPDDGVVAIQTVEKEMSGGQTHRIVEKRMHSENSYEIYSRPFIRKLREVEPGIEDGGAYRLTGSVIPSLKVAVFSLKTLQRMDEKTIRPLKIEPKFKNLIRPLQRKEYLQLEQNILSDGCRDPIITWNGVIVDGHNRYEICMRHQIPFAVLEMDFSCEAEAIAWICANQLGRRNISEETRKYLIGKQFEAEKLAGAVKNPNGNNQYSTFDEAVVIAPQEQDEETHSRSKTAERIAKDNHISKGTVEKYAIYARAMDALAEKDAEIVPRILSGQYKIAHKNVVELSKLSPPEIKKVERRIKKMQQPFIQYNQSRNAISEVSEGVRGTVAVTSIKDMPAFDPDADINGLALTIPSWSSSIDRVLKQTDLSIISSHAREGLVRQLLSLTDHVSDLLGAIKED